MKKQSIALICGVLFAISNASVAETDMASQRPMLETAAFPSKALPAKSRAVLKKLFPHAQLELGEVPAPYHHAGRERLTC